MKDELSELQKEYNTDELIESVVKVCDKLSDDDKEVILKLMDYGTALEMIILREKKGKELLKSEQYLKWEDLKFTDDEQKIKVKLNGEDYTVVYFKPQVYYSRSRRSEYVGILKDDDFIVYSSIITDKFVEHYYKKFFNDLHLEVVANE